MLGCAVLQSSFLLSTQPGEALAQVEGLHSLDADEEDEGVKSSISGNFVFVVLELAMLVEGVEYMAVYR